MTEANETGPQIVVAFQNYSPPFNAEKAIRRMLRIVPPKYLWGLHAVVLTNVGALSHKEREQRGLGRGRAPLRESLGYYNQAWKGQPARVTLLVDNLEKRWGRTWLRVGIVRDIALSELLYHELGHHIHRLHVPEYEGKENVAEKWSDRLSKKFLRERLWYLLPLAAPIALIKGLVEDIAGLFRRFRAKS
jgi:hypothetical protein